MQHLFARKLYYKIYLLIVALEDLLQRDKAAYKIYLLIAALEGRDNTIVYFNYLFTDLK